MTVLNRAASTVASRTYRFGETDPRTQEARSTLVRARIEAEITRGSADLNEQDRREIAALLTNP